MIKIHDEDKLNYKTVFSSDGFKIGEVEATLPHSFITSSQKENKEIKYEIARLEIASMTNHTITVKLKEIDPDQKFQISFIEKNTTNESESE
jgi:hypothetical protein